MKTILFFLALSLLATPVIATQGEGMSCSVLGSLLARKGFRPLTNILAARLSEEGFSRSPVINQLEAIHIARYQNKETYHRTFNPRTWALKDPESAAILLGDPDFRMIEGPDGQMHPTDIETLIDQWEKDFVKFGGQISTSWKKFDTSQPRKLVHQKGRDLFIQSVILESAYLFSLETGKLYPFSLVPDHEHSWQHVVTLLKRYFDDVDGFLQKYDNLARHRAELRVGPQDLPYTEALRAAARNLKGKGVDVRPHGKNPWVREHQRDLEIHLTIESIAEIAERMDHPELPFTIFVQETTDGGDDSQTNLRISEMANRVRTIFRGVGNFIQEANIHLGHEFFKVKPGRTPKQQLLIEVGTLAAIHNGARRNAFPKFTIGGSLPAYQISRDLRLLIDDAHLTLDSFNQGIRELLP